MKCLMWMTQRVSHPHVDDTEGKGSGRGMTSWWRNMAKQAPVSPAAHSQISSLLTLDTR